MPFVDDGISSPPGNVIGQADAGIPTSGPRSPGPNTDPLLPQLLGGRKAQPQQVYNVKAFAGVGDGTPRDLSSVFATLAAAQATFPRALALTESLDWHAHQFAIDAATANGGVVYTPAGKYMMSPCQGPLKFPLSRDEPLTPYGPNNAQVNWMGDGDLVTVLQWTADMGATPNSEYAVMCGQQAGDPIGLQADSRYGTTNANVSSGWFRDLSLVGPAYTLLGGVHQIGVTGCNMSAICWASHRELVNVKISWFYAGLDIVGDHTTLKHVQLNRNYYGIYMNHNSPYLYGDLTIDDKFVTGNNRFACVGFAYGGAMGTWHVRGRPFFGTSPFVFFKEATPANWATGMPTPAPGFLSGIQFDSLFTENVGNAVFWDDNIRAYGSTNTSTIDKCSFKHLTLPGWSDSLRLPGYDRCFMLVCNLNGTVFENVTKWEATGCTRPLFDVVGTMYGESKITGDIEALIASAAAAGNAVLYATVANGGSGHAVGDVIPISGGTPYSSKTIATVKVTTVTAGAITGIAVQSNGLYSVSPSATAAQGVSSGAGTGATFNLTMAPQQVFRASSDSNVKRMAVEHTHGDGAVGCWKGRFYSVYNGNSVVAGHALTEVFNGAKPARESDVSPFLGMCRITATSPTSAINVTTIVAEEGEDLPYFPTGPSNLQTLHKLTEVGGSLTNAQNMGDGRVVAYRTNAQLSVGKGYRGTSAPHQRPRTTEILAATTYTLVANDRGKLKRLNSASLQAAGGGLGSGGTGHAVNDILTAVGGTLAAGGTAATFMVKTVSAGVVTELAVVNPGSYTTLPANPCATTTSGAGTGATIFLVSEAAPIVVTLPSTFIAGYEVELWQGYLGSVSWVGAAGVTVTTAAGVTSTDGPNTSVLATVVNFGVAGVTIVNGGTGHAVNDIVTIGGGTIATNGVAATGKVTSVSGGVITGIVPNTMGNYWTGPTGTVAQTATTGTGTGFTCTVTLGNEWFIRPSAPRRRLVNTQTAAYTLQLADDNNTVYMNVSAAAKIYVRPDAPAGFKTTIIQGGAGQVTPALVNGGSITSYTGLTKTAGQYAKIELEVMSNAGNAPVVVISGQLA
jgi:hypothetical protein